MIKTNSFISVFLSVTLIMLHFTFIAKAENASEISLPSVEKERLITGDASEVFMPSKLVLGKDNKFIVRGKPGSKVSLAVSSSSYGAKPINGLNVRLGETEQTIESIISSTGVVELIYNVPQDETLLGQTKYFEVAVWTKSDFGDISMAKSISASGRETLNNGLKIVLPPETGKRPTFEPTIPGISGDLYKSIKAMKDVQDGKINPELIDPEFQGTTTDKNKDNNSNVK